MHATFIQKVIICAIAAFLAAGLIEWGKVFVTGADESLNGGYKQTAGDGFAKRR
jgi:nucleoside recognition membrane protein YjiH